MHVNNNTACFLNTEKWEKVVEYASKVSGAPAQDFDKFCHLLQVLESQPDNAKALFRRGTACIHLNLMDKARCDLTRAQEITPDSKELLL